MFPSHHTAYSARVATLLYTAFIPCLSGTCPPGEIFGFKAGCCCCFYEHLCSKRWCRGESLFQKQLTTSCRTTGPQITCQKVINCTENGAIDRNPCLLPGSGGSMSEDARRVPTIHMVPLLLIFVTVILAHLDQFCCFKHHSSIFNACKFYQLPFQTTLSLLSVCILTRVHTSILPQVQCLIGRFFWGYFQAKQN